MNVRHYELVEVANKFLSENYNLNLNIPIEFNARMTRVLGRFIFKKVGHDNVPLKIEMSIDFMKSHPKENIFDVFKHELVHYALCVMKKPFNDGQAVFENELRRLDIKRTNSFKLAGDVHKYVCDNCGSEYTRKRKLNKHARCNCSLSSQLKYLGIISVEAKARV